jgi:hypothetical protein
MLFYLLYPLHDDVRVLNVFRYITFRTALATLTALLISLALGSRLIERLREFQIGQQIRPEGPCPNIRAAIELSLHLDEIHFGNVLVEHGLRTAIVEANRTARAVKDERRIVARQGDVGS